MELHDLVTRAVAAGAAEAEDLARYMYEHPEIAKEEKLSSQAIVQILRDNGFTVTYPFMEAELGYGTAFMAVLENGEGPKAAILTEYDALPKIGHGCGHNTNAAMSVLAGTALMRLKDQWKGTLYLVGTPAEEAEGAKMQMAESGVFDDMDIAIMIHAGNAGVAQVNMEALSLRSYTVSFRGQTAHAAACPWSGRNALPADRKFLDLLDSRRDSFHPFAIASSIILEGGQAPNVVPDHAAVRLELRADSLERLEEMDRITRNCAKGAAIALDCTESFTKDFMDFYDMVRVPALEEKLGALLVRAGEILAPVVSVGSSDVGNVSYHCPTIQPMLCITKEKCAMHTTTINEATISDFGLSQMRKGAGVISEAVLEIFNHPEFCTQVRKDFEEARAVKQQAD